MITEIEFFALYGASIVFFALTQLVRFRRYTIEREARREVPPGFRKAKRHLRSRVSKWIGL